LRPGGTVGLVLTEGDPGKEQRWER
jgi:hypothetical protein